MADQAKGKGIAPERASNPADPGQSSRPPLPIRTLLEDEEDGEDYSEVIEVLKHLNTLKASVEDSVSAIKNISSTLASLTNSSNAVAATIGKTSYSPRFNPFSGTMDLDSPPRPPRKEPYLGPAVDNTATSNLDPPIDIGSKEGFKDTITSSIVKELSKKAYTILDDSKLSGESNFEQQYSRPIESKKKDVYNEFHALTFSTYRKGLSAFNAEFNSYLAKLTIAKIDIDPSLILNQYFKALESKFPSWVSRQKSSIRQARMLGLTASSLNIEYLMANILEESRNLAIEAYRAAYVANSSNSTPNSNSNPSKKGKIRKRASFILGSYNLAIEEEEESDCSSNSRYKKRKEFKGKGLKTSSNKAKYKDNQPRRRPRDPALYNSWLYNIGSTDHISNSKERFTTFTPNTGQLRPINTGNSPISPASIGSITLEVLSRKAPPTYTKLVLDNVLYLPNIDINIISGCNEIVVEIPSNSIRKEDYRPIIEDAIVSEAIEPNKRYRLRNSPAKGTTLEGIGPSLRGKRPCRPTREPEPLTGTRDLPCVLREPVIEGNKVEKAISSPTLKEPNIGQRDYYNLLNLAKLWHVRLGYIGLRLLKKTSSITKGLPNFDKIKEADFHCSSCDRGKAVRRVSKALIPDLPRVLDSIEGDTVKIRPRPHNRNPIVLLLVDRKSRYRWVFNLPNKSGPIVANAIKGFFRGLRNGFGRYPTKFHFDGGTEITDLFTTWLAKRGIKFSTSAPYIHEQNGLVERSVRVILDLELVNSTAITNKETTPFQALFNELEPGIPHIPNLERYRAIGAKGEAIIPLEKRSKSLKLTSRTEECKLLVVLGSKTYLVYIPSRRAVLKTSTVKFIEDNTVLKGAVSPDPSNLNTEKPISIEIGPSKLESYESSSDKLGVFKFLPRSLLPSNRKLITCRNVLKVKKDAKNRPIKYKSQLVARGFMLVEDLDYTITYASTSILPTWRILLAIGVFYNAKTCHFIVTYIDNCLFIGPNIGYITDLKKRLNKVYAIEDLGPAAYFLGWLSRSLNRPTKSHLNAAKNLFKYLNSTKDYSICFSYNGNTVANLGPKLSNSSNITTKLSRDFHSKEGPRPLTTTSTTIVDSRNLKATSKSTYGYLYKLAEAIREVQWIIGLFSELHRPIDYPITLYRDNQGSITVANDLALHARTKHTLLKFRYIREQVKAKIVTIIYLNTKYMPADGLTKALLVSGF
ncbi:hypothetical protein P8C59_005158 [Phyllachora maydis]|uniref:Integrase catalytic domain-containing protein n=1 Tax=Phyllachora maydis TaxID=1825666 RepID=A0AAD9MF80_9PEZI|nr:hypothetical protein P8C59_005158 [Phyllachora maydis]